ncbi:F-box only protein 21-like [Lineus longissimus]|uniref:F-box only protein 21-like n=1 Tax=Lineus longissimus TaxID=88925 RepID=UPI00315DFED9
MEDAEQVNHKTPGILCLPHEILELIFTSDSLDCKDICRVSNSCSQLSHAANSNEVWRQKLLQRYPRLYRQFPKHDKAIGWRKQNQQRHECTKEVWKQTERLSQKFYKKLEISNEGFGDYMKMVEDCEYGLSFIIDELICIINANEKHKDLTVKYYAKKAIRFFQPLHLKNEWKTFLALPIHEQTLEKGAVLIAQWCQPTADIVLEDIVSQIDAISDRVRQVVFEKHPHHPLVNGIDQNTNGLTESLWTSLQCRNILDATNHVLFKDMGFTACDNSDDEEQYYDERNSFIHEVLFRKRGIPITMCVLYSCVTRRLGVVCQLVSFPSHFLLRWREHPELEPEQQYTFIDVYGGGKFLNRDMCKNILVGSLISQVYLSDGVYEPIKPAQVFERMARNLVNIGRHHSQIGSELAALRSTIELFLAIKPGDIEHWLLLARLYLYLDINLTEVGDMFQHIEGQDPVRFGIIASLSERAQTRLETLRQEGVRPEPIVPNHRTAGRSKVEYSVGMILKHRRYHYKCVISGWDETCKASQEWILQMGVNNLPKKHHQPFYNVLAEDCSTRYAAQENLEYAPEPSDSPHPEIGKYFCEFMGTHYRPNDEKMQEYPDDYAITLKNAEERYPGYIGAGDGS